MDGTCSTQVRMTSEGKKLFGRSRRRWVDNIKMDLKKLGYEVMD